MKEYFSDNIYFIIKFTIIKNQDDIRYSILFFNKDNHMVEFIIINSFINITILIINYNNIQEKIYDISHHEYEENVKFFHLLRSNTNILYL